MNIGAATAHSVRSMQPQSPKPAASVKAPDADDFAAPPAAAPKLATSGVGQLINKTA